MKIFLDTSSLFKLYHTEKGCDELLALFQKKNISRIFLSTIAIVEYHSALYKKIRVGDMTDSVKNNLAEKFDSEWHKYSWIEDDTKLKTKAVELLRKYGAANSLKSMDSIQLATAVSLKGEADLFVTSDKILQNLFEQEGLPT